MWALTNRTPFPVERGAARDRTGAEVWIVVVKGTFRIRENGRVELADEQEPVHLVPVHFGDPTASSLRYEADMVLTKPSTDILLHGTAYAPGGRPVPELDVSMAVGPVRKTLRVVGDRVWEEKLLGPRLSEPVPFRQMPLLYERAYGGRHGEPPQYEPRNPVGRGFVTDKKALVGTVAPNIEYPGDPKRPAGFGPLAPAWLPRRSLAGTYDATWEEKRKPLVPDDFNDRYFQAAPEDQQTPTYLVGGEEVELRNLTPAGRFSFLLPKAALGFMTRFGRARHYHRGTLHTVLIEPDLGRMMMTWQTALPCQHTLYKLRDTTVFLKRWVASLGPDDPDRLLRVGSDVAWRAE